MNQSPSVGNNRHPPSSYTGPLVTEEIYMQVNYSSYQLEARISCNGELHLREDALESLPFPNACYCSQAEKGTVNSHFTNITSEFMNLTD